ncbi:hypothetical protein [Amphritea sp. HPY]|uniref:hypothetical protein n=1 Tax=Amphritea sp. HPY TaxID=3421652 RepID=UPI003D7EF4E0
MRMPAIKHWDLINPVLNILEHHGFDLALQHYRGIAGRLYSYEADWVWRNFDEYNREHSS